MIYQENKRPNLLHYEGEQYVLSAAFHTILEGFGVAPPILYIGLDKRSQLAPKDTIATVTKSEIKGLNYVRVPVSTGGGFVPTWEEPSLTEAQRHDLKGEEPPLVFVLNATATFIAKGEDLGQVRNYFLATAAEGVGGLLLISSALRKPFDLDKGYKLTVGVSASLRLAELEN